MIKPWASEITSYLWCPRSRWSNRWPVASLSTWFNQWGLYTSSVGSYWFQVVTTNTRRTCISNTFIEWPSVKWSLTRNRQWYFSVNAHDTEKWGKICDLEHNNLIIRLKTKMIFTFLHYFTKTWRVFIYSGWRGTYSIKGVVILSLFHYQ